ncbi:hypothetical protein SAMN05443432_103198 [Roseovarius litoreus]|jgi:hypothetical protein|uniref:Uncharacterized protein n=1 Tax=Roseovarius litoreus TaxID=1155722 RepID=A0A1M7E4J2_9RHOB|nr:hypothetical protein SAMN05443432_103198 [Roseovarius litoreus]
MTEAEHMGARFNAARHLAAQPFVATQAKAGTE